MQLPFNGPRSYGYSTIRSILNQDEEHPLSLITIHYFGREKGWHLGEMMLTAHKLPDRSVCNFRIYAILFLHNYHVDLERRRHMDIRRK
ncbi:MAG: hypothetical protein ABSA23_18625, partial [Anaerolineales bacterium]